MKGTMTEYMNRENYVVSAIAAEGNIRAFAATTRGMVEEARARHDTSPVVTAALGRLMTGAAMMGVQMKEAAGKLTLTVKGDGPVQSLTVVADAEGDVKGYAAEPQAIAHSTNGKLNVKGVVGKGSLTVVKDIGLKEPYVGTCELVSGEIAEDLTYYYAVSEQTPTVMALGVLMNKDNTVRQAGGFMIQLMPGASDELAAELENIVLALPPITSMLDENEKPEEILEDILSHFGYEELEKKPVRFRCDCSRDKIALALAGLNKYDLLDLMVSQKEVEVKCDYCGNTYLFGREELKGLYKKFHRAEKDERKEENKTEENGEP